MVHFTYASAAAYGAGLLLTLVLAAWLTPARWWRRLNAGALAIVVLGTWGLGTAALWLFNAGAAPPLLALAPAVHGVAAPTPAAADARAGKGGRYRVHEDLNLRSGTGTSAARIAIVPAGSVVTATGARQGDWWQVSARVNGRQVQGWSSSLWLRRADEGAL